jgi:hypothetical protein
MSENIQFDPAVKVPPAVAAAAARANELMRQGNAPTTPEVAPEPPAQPETIPTPSPEMVMTPTTPEVAPEAPTAPVQNGDWEQRYRSMEGRYKAELQRANALRDELQDARREVAALRAQAPAAPSNAPVEMKAERLLTDQEVTDYGEDFLNVVGKKAQELVQPLYRKVQEIEGKVSGVGQVMVEDARQGMLRKLTEAVPGWREINKNKQFLDWLDLPDRYTGATRNQLLQRAYAENDASRVATFFQDFAAATQVPVTPAQTAPEQPAQVTLESLAAPGRATASAPSGPMPQKPIISPGEIAAFYRRVNDGYYRGREAEKAQHEAMIFEAQKDGRIR